VEILAQLEPLAQRAIRVTLETRAQPVLLPQLLLELLQPETLEVA
jgi:hypothetical protein